MGYRSDREWSDRFLPKLRALIGPYLLVPSTLEQDTKEAADLVVLKGRDLTIACRVRRPGFAGNFGRQFTLRSRRESGTKTELSKVVDGWGDWFFYGHATTHDDIAPWCLIDLSHFRAHLIRNRKLIKYGEQPNPDQETYFMWFDIDSFPSDPALLIAESVETFREPESARVPLASDIFR